MNPFAQQVAMYNSTLPTLTDGDVNNLQVDVNGRLIVTTSGTSLSVSATDLDIRDLTHVSDSIRIGDGTDLANVDGSGNLNVIDANSAAILAELQGLSHAEDAAHVSGDLGIQMLAVRQDTQVDLGADGDYVPLSIDANGALRVSGAFTVAVDDVFESGTEADSASDNAGDGIVAITGTMTTVATLPVGAGTTAYVVGLDISADDQVTYELIVDDNGTPTEWIRAGVIDGAVSHNKTFPRAIEITGAANRSVILRAMVNQGNSGNAAGAINAYTR